MNATISGSSSTTRIFAVDRGNACSIVSQFYSKSAAGQGGLELRVVLGRIDIFKYAQIEAFVDEIFLRNDFCCRRFNQPLDATLASGQPIFDFGQHGSPNAETQRIIGPDFASHERDARSFKSRPKIFEKTFRQ